MNKRLSDLSFIGILGSGLVVVVSLVASLAMVMLYLTLMFWLIIRNFSLDLRLSSPAAMLGPSDAGAFTSQSGAHVSTGVRAQLPLVRPAGEGVAEGPRGTRGCGHVLPDPGPSVLSTPVDMGLLAGSLQPSDGLSDVLAILERPVVDIFPANRICMRCAKCGAGIPRFEGYRHIKVGDRRTFCASCHEAMGLPLREAVGGAHRRSELS